MVFSNSTISNPAISNPNRIIDAHSWLAIKKQNDIGLNVSEMQLRKILKENGKKITPINGSFMVREGDIDDALVSFMTQRFISSTHRTSSTQLKRQYQETLKNTCNDALSSAITQNKSATTVVNLNTNAILAECQTAVRILIPALHKTYPPALVDQIFVTPNMGDIINILTPKGKVKKLSDLTKQLANIEQSDLAKMLKNLDEAVEAKHKQLNAACTTSDIKLIAQEVIENGEIGSATATVIRAHFEELASAHDRTLS